MLVFLLAYLGGVLTIVSPCILPVLPFVFARAERPFLRSGLPLLAGMAVTFTAVASLAAVAGGWAVQANEYGRTVAVAVFPAASRPVAVNVWDPKEAACQVVAYGALVSSVPRSASSALNKTPTTAKLSVAVAATLSVAPRLIVALLAGVVSVTLGGTGSVTVTVIVAIVVLFDASRAVAVSV